MPYSDVWIQVSEYATQELALCKTASFGMVRMSIQSCSTILRRELLTWISLFCNG